MANNYLFLDGNSSILTAASSVVAGAHQPLVQVSSFLTVVPTTFSGSVLTAGAYNEDSASAANDVGLFALGIRNDTVASTVGADKDYTGIATDSAGRILFKPFSPDESRIYAHTSVVATASVSAVATPGTGLRNYITDITIANTGSVATLVTFSDTDGSVIGRTIAPATGGSNINGLQTPIRTGTVNQAIFIGSATATSVLYATFYGYKAP